MSPAFTAHDDVVVVRHKDLITHLSRQYAGLHASAPVLLGLSVIIIAACIAASLLLPGAVEPLIAAMAVLMIGAAGITFFSVYATGEVLEAQFDQTKRVARLLYRGPFAHTEWVVPLDKISDVRMAMGYDERGNKMAKPTLEFTSGRKIVLPPSTTWADLDAIRAMLETDNDTTAQAWARKTSANPEAYARMRRR